MSAGVRPGGLSQAQAQERLVADGPNALPEQRPPSLAGLVWTVIREPMLILLIAAGVINFVLAEPLEGSLLMGATVIVILITIYQERKTAKAVHALKDLTAPQATVLRDGHAVRIDARYVVVGDVLIVNEGDRVSADARLFEAENISVDESALTGESVPVGKSAAAISDAPTPGGDGTPWLFTGTLLTKGHGLAQVTATGSSTELGKIGRALSDIDPGRTRLQSEVNRIVAVIAVVAFIAAGLVAGIYALTRGEWLTGALAGIATAMAMLPEEFPVVLTVFMALGSWRMAQKHVITRRPPVIETLGSATVICTDKTGTLTMNQMTVKEVIIGSRCASVDDPLVTDDVTQVLAIARLASGTDPVDPMDKALHLASPQDHPHNGKVVKEYALSENLLAVSNVWQDHYTGELTVAAKGAPEAIAQLCGIGHEALARLQAQVEQATARGLRVLGVAKATHPHGEQLPEHHGNFAFDFVGLVALADPVRPGVPEAVAECTSAGVRIIMVTGDYPGTATAIAGDIGIANHELFMTGAQMAQLNDEQLSEQIAHVNVFARMVPDQKLRLVRALQAQGEVVAMTGDGVNDAPALRAADIGVAMGKRGTDVAREAAGLVITDDDFSSIVRGIRQGRAVYANLRKAMSFVLAVHVPILGMALVPVFVADWPLVLLPVQIAFLEFIIDPACSVVFESEEADPENMTRPPRKVNSRLFDRSTALTALGQGLSVFLAALAVYFWALTTGLNDDVVRSMTFATLLLSNVGLILINRSTHLTALTTVRMRRNPAVVWIVSFALVMLVLLLEVPLLRQAFNFGALTLGQLTTVLAASVAGLAWFEIRKSLSARMVK